MKRLALILGILLALIVLGVGVYLFFFAKNNQGTANGGEFPGSGNGTGATTTVPDVGIEVEGAGEVVAPKLVKITDGPVAVGTIALTEAMPEAAQGTTTLAIPTKDVLVRYVERGSGNMYEYRTRARTLMRLTNQTLPGIQTAAWTSDGSRAFVRYLSRANGSDEINTYALPASERDGYFLEAGLSNVVVNGTSTVLSVLPSTNGSIGTIATPLGTNVRTLFSSALSSLKVLPSGGAYLAVTKPSKELPGYAFIINPKTGEFTRLLGPLTGLTALPSMTGTQFLFTAVAGNTLKSSILDTVNISITALPLATFSEKCVWSFDSQTIYCAVPRALSGKLPDDWYQGIVSTSDRMWKIDLATRTATLVFDPTLLANTDIDAIALTLDSNEQSLVFTNKKDGSLWMYEL